MIYEFLTVTGRKDYLEFQPVETLLSQVRRP